MRLISPKKLFIGFVSNICSYVANFPAKKLRKNTVLKIRMRRFFLNNFQCYRNKSSSFTYAIYLNYE